MQLLDASLPWHGGNLQALRKSQATVPCSNSNIALRMLVRARHCTVPNLRLVDNMRSWACGCAALATPSVSDGSRLQHHCQLSSSVTLQGRWLGHRSRRPGTEHMGMGSSGLSRPRGNVLAGASSSASGSSSGSSSSSSASGSSACVSVVEAGHKAEHGTYAAQCISATGTGSVGQHPRSTSAAGPARAVPWQPAVSLGEWRPTVALQEARHVSIWWTSLAQQVGDAFVTRRMCTATWKGPTIVDGGRHGWVVV